MDRIEAWKQEESKQRQMKAVRCVIANLKGCTHRCIAAAQQESNGLPD